MGVLYSTMCPSGPSADSNEQRKLNRSAFGGKKLPEKERDALFEKLWKQWDLDNNGHLDKAEVPAVLAALYKAAIAASDRHFMAHRSDPDFNDKDVIAAHNETQEARQKIILQLESPDVPQEEVKRVEPISIFAPTHLMPFWSEVAVFFQYLDTILQKKGETGDSKVSKEEMRAFFNKEVGVTTLEATFPKQKLQGEKSPMKIPQGIPSVVGVKLAALEGMFESLVTSREGMGLAEGPSSAHQLAEVLRKTPNVAPMRVVKFSTLRDASRGGTVGELEYSTASTDVCELPADAKIVLVSHRWWSSPKAHPDQVDNSWPKVKFVVEEFVPHFCGDVGCAPDSVYVWWDFLSICQTEHELKISQIECLPIFVAMADSICALRSGDEDYYANAKEGHPGHYDNRVWTAVELYCATSKFVREFAGCHRRIYTVELDASMQAVGGIIERGAELRSRLHEAHSWALPPRTNLVCKDDLLVLEPLAVIMRTKDMPRIVAAAMCGLSVALDQYIESGVDVNAPAPVTGLTALHCAARRADPDMLNTLLRVPGLEVNSRDSFGNTALHDLIRTPYSVWDKTLTTFQPGDDAEKLKQRRFEKMKECMLLLVEHGGDPVLCNRHGRSVIDMHLQWSEDPTVFGPGHEEEVRARANAPKEVKRAEDNFFSAEKLAQVCAEHKIQHTRSFRDFDSGNRIAWEEFTPEEPKDLAVWWNGAFLTFELTRRFAFELCLASGYKVLILNCPGVPPNWVKEGGIAHFKDTHAHMLLLLPAAL